MTNAEMSAHIAELMAGCGATFANFSEAVKGTKYENEANVGKTLSQALKQVSANPEAFPDYARTMAKWIDADEAEFTLCAAAEVKLQAGELVKCRILVDQKIVDGYMSPLVYCVVMHELGHIYTGANGVDVRDEIAAWAWAVKHAKTWCRAGHEALKFGVEQRLTDIGKFLEAALYWGSPDAPERLYNKLVNRSNELLPEFERES